MRVLDLVSKTRTNTPQMVGPNKQFDSYGSSVTLDEISLEDMGESTSALPAIVVDGPVTEEAPKVDTKGKSSKGSSLRPFSFLSGLSSTSLESLDLHKAPSYPSSDAVPINFMDQDDMTIIRKGLEEALGQDGNGAWLSLDKDKSKRDSRTDDLHDISNDDSLRRTRLDPDMTASDYNASLTANDPFISTSSSDAHKAAEEGTSRRDRSRSPSRVRANSERPLSFQNAVHAFSSRVVDEDASDFEEPQGMLPRGPSIGSHIAGLHVPQYPDSVYLAADDESSMFTSSETSAARQLRRNSTAFIHNITAGVDSPIILYGNSLGIFRPSSPLRQRLYRLLHKWWVSPFVLGLILFHLILLCIQNSSTIFPITYNTDVTFATAELFPSWGKSWFDFAYLVIFLFYTCEMCIKIIVFNLWDDAALFGRERSTLIEFVKSKIKIRKSVVLTDSPTLKPTKLEDRPVYNTMSALISKDIHSKGHVHERAFLRSSWNRVDFISIVSYWLSLFLSIGNFQNRTGFFVFKALSCIRIFRFLAITKDTSIILRGLKQAYPFIMDVSLFIGFFWALFAFIGVQSFSSSLRRTCIWVDPQGQEANFSTGVFCGSYLDPQTLKKLPYVFEDGTVGPVAKGLTCPVNSLCVSGENPYGGTVSFDNIFNSLELTFVVMTVNTFTDIMYDTIRTDYLAASLFFVFGALVLSFWLSNLLVAVVATEFRHVRRKYAKLSEKSPFNNWFRSERSRKFLLRRKWGRALFTIRWIWLIVIAVDLIIACTVGADASDSHILLVYHWQLWTTGILLFEIIVRFCCYLPFWREFWRSKSNVVDTFLAFGNIFVVLPFVHKNGTLYGWLTVFQIMRFYRLTIAIPSVKNLWIKVLGNYRTILALTVFLFMLTLFAGILASQLLRGIVPMADELSFFDLSSSFLGMYTISTTENWTVLLYAAVEAAASNFAGAFYGAMFIMWFMFSNYLAMNMFIGVINENLEISDEGKRKEQIRSFISNYALSVDTSSFENGVKFFKNLGRSKPDTEEDDVPQSSKAVFNLLLERRIIQDFIVDEEDDSRNAGLRDYGGFENVKVLRNAVAKIKGYFNNSSNPFRRKVGIGKSDTSHLAQDFLNVRSELLELKRQYLEANKNYNVSLYMFKPYNKVRNFCQRIVGSSYGERIEGLNPTPLVWYSFSALMLTATFGMVVTTCINTPLYFTEHFLNGSYWIFWTDGVFMVLFTIEFIIKIIADGMFFTPNGYLRSPWNVIDCMVLITLWITFCSESISKSYNSHYIRAMQAFRALRLLSISRRAQRTFYDVVLAGFWKILGAGLISLTLLFPFSLWGLNIFRGKLSSCTDGDLTFFSDCIDEFQSTPYNWDIWAPRAMTHSYYDFDSFPHAFRIQFEVISLEGWVDVLQSVMAITGKNTNPQEGASLFNAVFPVFYNIIGTIFILTLFISVIIRNYSESRGTAYLTDEQQSWYDLEKRLGMIKPKRLPKEAIPGTWRYRLQGMALQKRSWLSVLEWFFLIGTAVLLLSEYDPSPVVASLILRVLYLLCSFCYIVVLAVRLYALGWRHFFQDYWNIYACIALTASFFLALIGTIGNISDVFYNFQKLCMVGSLLLFIPKSRRLNILFSAATGSMIEIGNLLITWFILFLVYAIAFNQVFGLTKLGSNGTDSVINFRTVPKALVLLFRMSCGEGWNQILQDFLTAPPYCVQSDEFSSTDCGSHPAAYILFITWNLLSMYIFVNLFVSLIYENFSYILHKSVIQVTEDDVENFKAAWSQFDPRATGYIAKTDLHKLLRASRGYFSLKIYDDEYSVPAILSASMARGAYPYDVNIHAINEVLKDMPVELFRQRRRIFDTFCEQALLEAHPQKGIALQKLVRQFPIYKDLDSNRCLTLEDYLKSKLLMQKVHVELLKKRVIGFLETVRLRREFEHRTQPSSLIRKNLSTNNPFRNSIPVTRVSAPGVALDLTPGEIDWEDSRGRTSSVETPFGTTANSTSPRRNLRLL